MTNCYAAQLLRTVSFDGVKGMTQNDPYWLILKSFSSERYV